MGALLYVGGDVGFAVVSHALIRGWGCMVREWKANEILLVG